MRYVFYDEYGYIDPDEPQSIQWIMRPRPEWVPDITDALRFYTEAMRRPLSERLDTRPEVPAVYLKAFSEEEI